MGNLGEKHCSDCNQLLIEWYGHSSDACLERLGYLAQLSYDDKGNKVNREK